MGRRRIARTDASSPFAVNSLALLQMIEEPGPGKSPIPFDGAWSDIEGFGRLFDRKAAEKPTLNNIIHRRI